MVFCCLIADCCRSSRDKPEMMLEGAVAAAKPWNPESRTGSSELSGGAGNARPDQPEIMLEGAVGLLEAWTTWETLVNGSRVKAGC